MYYIGLDVHKKTISYCVKDVSGRIQQEGKIGSTRRELDCWMKTLPQPWTVAMEATIFSGWIYDHLLPHADPDQGGTSVDAARDCCSQEEERPDRCQQARRLPALRLPPRVPHDACSDTGSKAHAAVPASAGAADGADEEPRVSGLLMETGVEYNKQRLHKVSYFRELLSANEEVHPSIRPLLKLSRETIERCQKTEYASGQFVFSAIRCWPTGSRGSEPFLAWVRSRR